MNGGARIATLLAGVLACMPASLAHAANGESVRVHVTLREAAPQGGRRPAMAREIAATLGGVVDATSMDADGGFDLTIAPSAVEALRGDSRVRSVQVLTVKHQANVDSSWNSGGYVYDGAGNIIEIGLLLRFREPAQERHGQRHEYADLRVRRVRQSNERGSGQRLDRLRRVDRLRDESGHQLSDEPGDGRRGGLRLRGSRQSGLSRQLHLRV